MSTDAITGNESKGNEALPPVNEQIPRWKQRLTKRNPEQEYASDEEAKKAFYELYDEDNETLQTLKSDNEKMFELLQDNPEFAEVFTAIRNGVPLRVALARVIDFDAVVPEESDPDYADFQKSTAEFKTRRDEIKKHREQVTANQEKSKVDIEDFFNSNEISEEEQNGFHDFLKATFDDLFNGLLNKATLTKLWQAFKYNEDVAMAREEGEIDGRNQQITTKRMATKKTDGLPDQGGGGAVSEAPVQKQPNNIVEDVVQRASNRKKIFE